jgi:hypothetical protein
MTTIDVSFKLQRETSGALFYKEEKPDGGVFNVPNEPGCKIGALYLRKSEVRGKPEHLKIQITY